MLFYPVPIQYEMLSFSSEQMIEILSYFFQKLS